MRFSAVFFDAGETLVHPHPTFPDLFARVLASEGVAVDPATVHQRAAVVFERFHAAAEAKTLWTTSPERSRAFWHDVYEILLADLGVERPELVDVVYRAFTDLSNYALFEDVAPVLEELRATGLTLGVISNFEEWLDGLLEAVGVRSAFDVRVISGIEGIEKPDPRIFEVAMERAGVEPSRSVYVGDNPEFDVEPALAVGMFPVLIDRRDRFPESSAARIRSMAELPAVLERAA